MDRWNHDGTSDTGTVSLVFIAVTVTGTVNYSCKLQIDDPKL